jgi:hypothetical protein
VFFRVKLNFNGYAFKNFRDERGQVRDYFEWDAMFNIKANTASISRLSLGMNKVKIRDVYEFSVFNVPCFL